MGYIEGALAFHKGAYNSTLRTTTLGYPFVSSRHAFQRVCGDLEQPLLVEEAQTNVVCDLRSRVRCATFVLAVDAHIQRAALRCAASDGRRERDQADRLRTRRVRAVRRHANGERGAPLVYAPRQRRRACRRPV